MSQSTKLKIAFFAALAAVAIHFYLADHFYNLSFGLQAGESLCNISSKINCDTVTASGYSTLFGVPIALWGATTNAVLALFLLLWFAGWTDNVVRLSRYTLGLSTLTAVTSLVMGSISTFLIGSYCLFCMAEYVLSFVLFGLIWSAREKGSAAEKSESPLRELFGPAKMYLALFVAIPASAFFLHSVILSHYDAQELPSIVRNAVADWQASPEIQFTETPSIVKGATEGKMIISEFADFRCPHCRHATSPIKAFVNAHPDTQLRFYSFPLDGTCNAALPSGDGISCFLARTVYCSEKVANKGWLAHDFIYEHQDEFISNPSMTSAKEKISDFLTKNNVKPEDVLSCTENEATDKAIRAQAKLGDVSGVRGTPTFYINGRKLGKGQLIPVLEAVHATLVK